ncbi:MAG: glycosyltransferase family A protein [Acidobacteriota bacterium]
MNCTVIVPTFNRCEVLRRCLTCLAEQNHPRAQHEIIVVDDGSTDGTSEFLQRNPVGPTATVLANARRLGPGASRNVALERARGDIVLFLDDDALAPPWLVDEHVRTHRRRPGVIVDGPAITTRGLQAPTFGSLRARVLARADVIGQPFVTVNASAPLADLRACGGFDETMLRWEDADLERRLGARGLGRVRNRRAWVWHWKPRTGAAPDPRRAEEENGYWAGMYSERWRDRRSRRMARLRYLTYDAILRRLGVPDYPPIVRVRAYAAGLRRALHGSTTAGAPETDGRDEQSRHGDGAAG